MALIDKPLHLASDTRALRVYNFTTQASYVDFVTTSAGGMTVTPAVAAQTLSLANTLGLAVGGALAVTGAVTFSTVLGVASGGTGLVTYTAAGRLLYSTAATTTAALALGSARQLLQVNAGATAPEWASNIDIPGTLDVTGAAVFDSTVDVKGWFTVESATGGTYFGKRTTATATIGSAVCQINAFNGANRVVLFEAAVEGAVVNSGRYSVWTMLAGSLAERFRTGSSGNLSMNEAAKFYFDGVAATGDTYAVSPSANVLDLYAGGAKALSLAITTVTLAGTAILPAATTSLSPLRIPHGTAHSSPTNGDIWTTTAGVFARVNGATYSLNMTAV